MKRRHSGFAIAILLLVFAGCTDDSDVTNQTVPLGERPLSVDSSNAPEPTPEQKVLTPTLRNVPGRVRLGNDLRYVVELLNETEDDIPLDPCPAFYQAWGESGTAYFGPGFLNCEDAPSVVPAGGAVRFRMVLELPEDNIEGQDFFTGNIVWYLGRSGSGTEPAFSKTVVVSKGACLEVKREGGRLFNSCSEGRNRTDSEGFHPTFAF